MIENWISFWFGGDGLFELAMARIFIVGFFLYLTLTKSALNLIAWQKAMFSLRPHWRMPYLLELIRFPILDFRVGKTLVYVYQISLLFTLIGLFTSVSSLVAFFLGLYVLGIRHGLKINHQFIPIHFVMLAFALSPSGAMLSVDSLVFSQAPTAADGMVAHWALQFIRVTIVLVVFATGVAKARHIGFKKGFIKRGSLSTLLRLHDFPYFYAAPKFSISRLLNRFPLVEAGLSWSVVFIELFFPVVLFSGIAQAVMVPGFVLCILGFRIFQGPPFEFFSFILIGVFVPWSQISIYLS